MLRGAALKRDMSILDQRISAAMESIAPLMLEANALIRQVIDEFATSKGGLTADAINRLLALAEAGAGDVAELAAKLKARTAECARHSRCYAAD